MKVRAAKKKTGCMVSCIVCSKTFYVRKYRIQKAKYCSRSCLAKNHLTKFTPIHGFKKTGDVPHKYKTISVNGKQVRLHRYIMEQYIGRKLEKHEHVHHINGNSLDNNINNLKVLSNSDHQKEEHLHRKRKTFTSSSF